jgi:hypothetical protein
MKLLIKKEAIKMNGNEKKILQMLADGKINVEEAQRLLVLMKSGSEIEGDTADAGQKAKSNPRFMHVVVEPKEGLIRENGKLRHHGKVNVRVPLGLIRAGIKLATLIPPDAAEHVDNAFKEKGFSFDVRRLKEEDLAAMVDALQESEINVETDFETVKINAE